MSGVFISYAKANEADARALTDRLRLQGYTVWRDDQLPAHRVYADVIEERLTAAEAVLVLWSADAAKSHWVRAEADTARQAGKLVQVSLDGAPLPLPFNQIHCVDLSGGGADHPAWPRVLASVAALAGGGPAKVSPPPAPAAGQVSRPGPAAQNRASIAVLPFKDLAGGAGDDLFAEGVVEEIATVLARFGTLFVLGASTSRVFDGGNLTLPAIARELGVRYLLTGSVRRAGGRVRIAVALVDGEGGAQIWADRFDDDLVDVFEIQDRIANAVASRIDATIESVETRREIERPTDSPGAYELFLRANAATMSWDRDDMARAIVAAKEALAIDPQFAWAAVVLAMSHAAFYHSQWDDDSEGHRESAHRYLNMALRLRNDDPYVLAHGAGVLVAMGEDLPTAQRLIARGLELTPGSALTRLYAGWVAIAADRPEDGLTHFEESLRLDPHSKRRYAILSGRGLCLFALGRLEEANASLAESERLAPDHTPATLGLALCLAAQGRSDEARGAVSRIDPPAALARSIAVLQNPDTRAAMHGLLAGIGVGAA
jgi:adenylate cyclase